MNANLSPNILHPLYGDLAFILSHTADLWKNLHHKTIFITGGTGFFGTWLLETLAFIHSELACEFSVTVLTRDYQAFKQKCPHLAAQALFNFHEGDIENFHFPHSAFDYIIHAATPASATLNTNHPLVMFNTIIKGTERVLEFAKLCKPERLLFISSGAVYGKQPPDISHLSEEHAGKPDLYNFASAYGMGKLAAEHLCALFAQQYNLHICIARCFAFVGPYLPLNTHFAIGNFILDKLHGRPLNIKGDGTPYRSYLYVADLMIWLWTILFRGDNLRPYNTGSDQSYSIAEIAQLVAHAHEPHLQVNLSIAKPISVSPERYVPDITRAQHELNLIPRINLTDAINATLRWHKRALTNGSDR